MNARILRTHHIFFAAVLVVIALMSSLNADIINEIYQYSANLLSIDPALVRGKNATTISNFGHVIACFLLTILAFRLFLGSYVKSIFFVASVACLIEFTQLFIPSRRSSVEDILLGFSGILLAVFLVFAKKRFTSSPPATT